MMYPEWLAVLLRIQEVPDSILGSVTVIFGSFVFFFRPSRKMLEYISKYTTTASLSFPIQNPLVPVTVECNYRLLFGFYSVYYSNETDEITTIE
jgi:hypothetical protein